MDDDVETTKAPSTAAAPAPAPAVELRNSLWCVHTVNGRVGMINELNSGVATFHYVDKDGELEESVRVLQGELRIAKASELPDHVELTAQQLKDIGYV